MSVHVTRMVTLVSGAILWKGYYESLQSIAIENKNKWYSSIWPVLVLGTTYPSKKN